MLILMADGAWRMLVCLDHMSHVSCVTLFVCISRGSLPLPRANMYSTISPSTPINTNTNTNPNPTFESGTPLSPPPALPVALTTPSLVPPTLPPLPSADSIDEGTVETDDMHLESVSTGTRSAEPQLQATSSSAS